MDDSVAQDHQLQALRPPWRKLPRTADGTSEPLAGRDRASSQRLTVVVGLVAALLIAVAAWVVAGREGLDQIGRGGINFSLLPKVGQAAPDVAVLLVDGKLVRLSDYRGQPVWLNFWGSWCPPCRAEMPDMEAAYEELAPRGLVMLAVSVDEPAAQADEFARLNHVTYLIASDPRRLATGSAYPITNFPTHILIDRDGIVRDVVLQELDKDEFLQHAATILAPPIEPTAEPS